MFTAFTTTLTTTAGCSQTIYIIESLILGIVLKPGWQRDTHAINRPFFLPPNAFLISSHILSLHIVLPTVSDSLDALRFPQEGRHKVRSGQSREEMLDGGTGQGFTRHSVEKRESLRIYY